ncbi:MAG: hypothetical protein WCU00_04820, partial [Candidatus Latescibacterota bacterium]
MAEEIFQSRSRRKFLKVGASMALASTVSPAGAKVLFKRTSPGARDLLKVGLLLGEGGHSN